MLLIETITKGSAHTKKGFVGVFAEKHFVHPCWECSCSGSVPEVIFGTVVFFQEWKWIYGKTPRFSVTFSTNLSSKDIVSGI